MNGIVEITVKKKKHVLRFGMQGCFEFQLRNSENPTKNQAIMITNLIYSGLYGESMASGKPAPDYKEVFILTNDLYEEDNYSEQIGKVWECFHQSKFGRDWMDAVTELGKKKAGEDPNQ